jgi:primosomal protein N'
MSDKLNEASLNIKIAKLDISMNELIIFFRQKCKICGHQRIMHDECGKCEGVMNKPCTSGCDKYNPE